MKIFHVVPGLNEKWNGIAVAAKLIADGQRAEGIEAKLGDALSVSMADLNGADEVWVHSLWTARQVWRACWLVMRARKTLVRMTHANLDPIRVRYHGWKKLFAAPVERWLFSKTDRVVVTGEWEAAWCREWGLRNEMQILDLKQYFNFDGGIRRQRRKAGAPLHVLYLGRRHPLKGLRYLEQAVAEMNGERGENGGPIELRAVSDSYGEELENVWKWADILCLPTLSENFGLVVAEALEHGCPVVTTDGAPAWETSGECWAPLVYLRGYRTGTDAERVKLLKDALSSFSQR